MEILTLFFTTENFGQAVKSLLKLVKKCIIVPEVGASLRQERDGGLLFYQIVILER